MTGGDEDYRLTNKKEREDLVKTKLDNLSVNYEFAKILNENEDLLKAFDGKSFFLSAMVYKGSYYPRIETGYLITPNKEIDFIK